MVARVTFALVRIDKLDQAVAFMRETVLPAMEAQPGFQSLEILVDRGRGDVLLISRWSSVETRRASAAADYFRDLHAQVVDVLTGPPEVRDFDSDLHESRAGSLGRP